MPTIFRQFRVGAAADETWRRLADVGAINQLMTFLGEVDVDGDRRSCSLGDVGRLDERILSVDDKLRRVAYSIQSSPLRFEHHSASMSVNTDPDGHTMITWITDYAPASLAAQVEPLIDQGVASMTEALVVPKRSGGSDTGREELGHVSEKAAGEPVGKKDHGKATERPQHHQQPGDPQGASHVIDPISSLIP